jgi:predicted molibdopterin-dependent oxidoreductase YjgC
MSDAIEIVVNAKVLRVEPGVTVASALLNNDHHVFRRSTTGEVRAPVCGMGICYECRVTLNGVAHQRACMVAVEHGMRVDTGNAS